MSAFSPPIGMSLPPGRFNSLIATVGQRVGWLRSHACPCVWSQSPFNGKLSTQGSPQRACQTCLGIGIYWDLPTLPFQVGMTFRERSPTPVEPGVVMNDKFGMFQSSEPSLTIPYCNPYLDPGDPQQSTIAWQNASTDDMFVAVDMLARYTAVLQVSGQAILPFQQNLQVASSGAVTVWNGAAQAVTSVTGYTVSGATVTIPAGYPAGTTYMVEFLAAALFVAFRRAGGLPHSRPLGGGVVNEPRVFHIQSLDYWTRQRGIQPTVSVGGCMLNMAIT
jgi:hypothetical protein